MVEQDRTQIPCYSQINKEWDSEKLEKAEKYSQDIGTFAFILLTNGKVVKAWGDAITPTNLQSARITISSSIYYTYIDRGMLDPDKSLEELGIDDYPNPLTKLYKQANIIHLL